jgi:hypothetical protein
MRPALAGPFLARELRAGAWQLTAGGAAGPEIYLSGVDQSSAEILRGASVTAVAVEWRERGVKVTLTAMGAAHVLQMRGAIVHEPLNRLYEGLPLAVFDDAARRFWRRLFRLVRIPGGRYLLGFIARRTRAAK